MLLEIKTGSQIIHDVQKILTIRFQTHEISVAHDNEHRIFNMSVTVRFVILVVVIVVVVVVVVYVCCQEVWSNVFFNKI